MCGIAGIVTKTGEIPDQGMLGRMQQAIRHRGPDAQGQRLMPGCGLAHQRLSIIDLSPAGAQPLADAAGKCWIVFNGEIYNYRELRQELEGLGHRFHTQTDTEVIVEGYKRWGKDVLPRLRGMFAFAIWDTERRVLLLARDHIGKKPLFYTQLIPGVLAFASEIKSIQAILRPQQDLQAIRLFLGLQYVPSPKTGFVGIAQLMPGSFLEYAQGQLTEGTYLDARILTPNNSRPQGQMDNDIRGKLEEAVRLRQLASDVPVGAFLSGGIDSAAVIAFASRHIEKLKTFTMGFDQAEFDERAEARRLAMHFKTDHQEFLAKPEDLLRIGDEVIRHYDAPYADSSALPVWLLAEQTASQVKVVLTGDGGDELFGGYRRYLHFIRGEQIARLPLLGAWTGHNMRKIGTWFHDADIVRMGRLVEALRRDPSRAYGELFCGAYFDTHDLHRLCKKEFLEATEASDAPTFVSQFVRRASSSVSSGQDARLSHALDFDLFSYLPDDLNVKMDRATMRWGLEARSPFLDQELLAFALTIPLDQKVSKGKTKIALKRALSGIVPEEVLTRQKRGFQVPLAEWFRGPLTKAFKERCLDPQGKLAEYVDLGAVQGLLELNQQGVNHGNRLWMLYSLATWLQATGG